MRQGQLRTLVGLIESNDDSDVFAKGGRLKVKAMPPAKKGRPAATSTVTKPTRGKQTAARNALTDKTGNAQESSEQTKGIKRPASDDSDEEEERDAETKPKAGRGRPRTNKAQKVIETGDDDELSQIEIKPTVPVGRGRRPKVDIDAEIPETQQPEKDIPEIQQADFMEMVAEEDEQIDELPTYYRQGMSSVQRHQSRLLFSSSRRPISTSESESKDPTLRRRLGELMRKHEALEARYRDLREISVQEAERNFDRLKKQGEERANTDKQLIATLKAELAVMTRIAKNGEQTQKQLEESRRKEEESQAKLSGLYATLAESKAEIKTLITKLTAARSAESVANTRVPGSAMKNSHPNNRLAANAIEAANQIAQKKENLYGDLTGLLVCGVKRENEEEVFDCVQTGRNGTLHFKLSVSAEGPSNKFEDAQFMYMPQLDDARDEELIETLPDYLVEEISFPRLHAAKFYSRVVKALDERFD